MKNNPAKKIGAFLLAAAMTVPSASELALLGTLKISAADGFTFVSENTKVSGKTFAVEVKAVGDVEEFSAEKFTVSSDAEGNANIADVSVTTETADGSVVFESSVTLNVTFPDGTESGTYYLFYDGGAVGVIEYDAAEENAEPVTVAEAPEVTVVEEVTEETEAVSETAAEENVSETVVIEEISEEVLVGEEGEEEKTAPTLTIAADTKYSLYFGNSSLDRKIKLDITTDNTDISYDKTLFAFSQGSVSVNSSIQVDSLTVTKPKNSDAKITLVLSVSKELNSGNITVKYDQKDVSGTISYTKTAISSFEDWDKKTINKGDKFFVDCASGAIGTITSTDDGNGNITDVVSVNGKIKGFTEVLPSKIKWSFKTPDNKPNSGAKFEYVVNGATKTAASVTGVDSFNIVSTNSSNAFNNQLILEAVDTTDNNKVIGRVFFYVKPLSSTKFNVTEKSNSNFVATTEEGFNYSLSIDAGKSFSLPIKTDSAVNKSVNYTVSYDTGSAGCFTVINGSVKGIKNGSGTITVTPQDNSSVTPIKIKVQVADSAKFAARANTTSISLIPGASTPQTFTVSGTTPTDKGTATISFSSDKFTVKYNNAEVNNNGEVSFVNGAAKFEVYLKEDVTVLNKNDSITVTVKSDSKQAKVINIKTSLIPVYTNVKAFKQAGKVKDGFIEVNVPIGSTYNLGMSVTPATANGGFTLNNADGKPSDAVSYTEGLSVNGDVVQAKKSGTYYIQATADGHDASGVNIKSKPYKINVYNPASGFEVPDTVVDTKTTYGIRGGYLVAEPETVCDKTFKAGTSAVISCPLAIGGDEEVIWTSNKANGLGVAVDTSTNKMTLNCIMPGTYTVTGVTKYTKQKYSFKVFVAENVTAVKGENGKVNSSDLTDDKLSYEILRNGVWTPVSSEVEVTVKIGESVNIRLKGNNVGAPVSYKIESGSNVSVSGAGLVKVTAKATVNSKIVVKGTMTSKTVKLEDGSKASASSKLNIKVIKADVDVTKVVVPSYGINSGSGKISISGKNLGTVKWQYKDGENNWKDCTMDKNAIKFLESGTSMVVKAVNDDGDLTGEYTIPLFEKAAKSLVVDNTCNSVKVSAFNGASAGERNPKELTQTAYSESTYIIPLYAYAGKTDTIDPGEIVWTSSNVNIAKATSIEKSDFESKGINGKYQAAVEIKTYGFKHDKSGKVTLTGVCKNSNKKINIVLNVKKDTAGLAADNRVSAIKGMGDKMTVTYDKTTVSPTEDNKYYTFDVVATLGDGFTYNDLTVNDIDKALVTFSKNPAGENYKKVSGPKVVAVEIDSANKKKITFTVQIAKNFATQKLYLAYNGVVSTGVIDYVKSGDGTAENLSLSADTADVSTNNNGVHTFEVKILAAEGYRFDQKKFSIKTDTDSAEHITLSKITFNGGLYTIIYKCDEAVYKELKEEINPNAVIGLNTVKIYYNGDAIGNNKNTVKLFSFEKTASSQEEEE